MSKYEPLWTFLKNREKDAYKISFNEIEKICGFPIDHSFLSCKKESKDFGYEVKKISMKERYIIFGKIGENNEY